MTEDTQNKPSIMTEDTQNKPSDDKPPVVRSEEIFRGRREIVIEHEGARYRLRITRRGKLILQK